MIFFSCNNAENNKFMNFSLLWPLEISLFLHLNNKKRTANNYTKDTLTTL